MDIATNDFCWGYVDSKADTNIYLIKNPITGTGIYVEDDNKIVSGYVGKYIVFKGETSDISVPLFTAYKVSDWGDTYSL